MLGGICLATEAKKSDHPAKGRFGIWNRIAGQNSSYLGITFRQSKLLDELSFFTVLFTHTHTHTHDRQRQRQRRTGKQMSSFQGV